MVSAPIRIQDKGDRLHLSVAWSLLECDAKLLKPFAGFLDVVDSNSDMAKSFSRIGVATRVALEVCIRFSSMIMS